MDVERDAASDALPALAAANTNVTHRPPVQHPPRRRGPDPRGPMAADDRRGDSDDDAPVGGSNQDLSGVFCSNKFIYNLCARARVRAAIRPRGASMNHMISPSAETAPCLEHAN